MVDPELVLSLSYDHVTVASYQIKNLESANAAIVAFKALLDGINGTNLVVDFVATFVVSSESSEMIFSDERLTAVDVGSLLRS